MLHYAKPVFTPRQINGAEVIGATYPLRRTSIGLVTSAAGKVLQSQPEQTPAPAPLKTDELRRMGLKDHSPFLEN